MPDPKTTVERAGTTPSTAVREDAGAIVTPDEEVEELNARIPPSQAALLLGLVGRVQNLEGLLSAERTLRDTGAIEASLERVRVLAISGRDRTIANSGQAEWDTGSQNAEWREIVRLLE